MKLNHLTHLASALFVLCQINALPAVEYTLQPGDVISIKSSSGKTTYHFNSQGVKRDFIKPRTLSQQNIQKRIHKCDRLLLAHQDAGLHKHHPDQYFKIEELLDVSRKHQLSAYEDKAETSIIEVERILKNIEDTYPEQNFSSIRNCFNLTRWEQCI